MNFLFFSIEYFTNGYKDEILNLLSIISIFCAISVIIIKNPIFSILFLIGLFLSVSSYLIILGISFIGLSYLIVYIGAVSILFLFILMLINIRTSELQSNTSNSLPLTINITILFNYFLFQLLTYNFISSNYNKNIFNNIIIGLNNKNLTNYSNNNDIYFVLSQSWDNNLMETINITNIGNIMYTYNNIWLIIASLILLLAMVGSIVITIKQK